MTRRARFRLALAATIFLTFWASIWASTPIAGIVVGLIPWTGIASSIVAVGWWVRWRRQALGPRPPRRWKRDDAVSLATYQAADRTASYLVWVASHHCPPAEFGGIIARTEPGWRDEATTAYRHLQRARLSDHPALAVWACDVLEVVDGSNHQHARYPG